jgi:hypothetical protein
MPRKKLEILPGRENRRQNCFAFYIDKSGAPSCRALDDVYCLKETTPCSFRKTPEAAAEARRKVMRRLVCLGKR